MNADGGPAFPVPDTYHPDGQIQYGANGMSLRDWFASQEILDGCDEMSQETMEALAGRPFPGASGPGTTAEDRLDALAWNADWRSKLKYIRADAMLRARERGREGGQGGEKMPNEELPDEHWHKIQTRPSLSWHPARVWEAACELRGKMMYGRGKTIAQAQANLRAEWEGGGQ